MIEDNPLQNKPKRRNKDGEVIHAKVSDDPVIAKAMQTMDEKFTVFDFSKRVVVAANGAEDFSMISIHKDIMEGRDDEVGQAPPDCKTPVPE